MRARSSSVGLVIAKNPLDSRVAIGKDPGTLPPVKPDSMASARWSRLASASCGSRCIISERPRSRQDRKYGGQPAIEPNM